MQEWLVDWDNPEDQHSHVSHLFGVHPGRQIIPGRDEKLAEAARVSLNARGDAGTGWSKAWKIAFWARLRDGDRAYKLTTEHICNNFHPNLFDFHPPFVIDGNFGHAAGVAECFLQSHKRLEKAGKNESPWIIELLPALPTPWHTGYIRGMLARGNIKVDMKWKAGKPVEIVLLADRDVTVHVAFGRKTKKVELKKDKPGTLGAFE